MSKQQKKQPVTDVTTTTATHGIYIGTSTVGHEPIQVEPAPHREKELPDDPVREAVYNYLRFLRTRGVTVVGADEVAKALSLPISQVERVAATLHTRGVKVEK